MEFVNSYHCSIKYIWAFSAKEITYLDMKVGLDASNLVTDVYSKETDTHQCLDNRSCRQMHVKKGIPYGQSLRLKRICQSYQIFNARLDELRDCLLEKNSVKRKR